MVSLGDRLRSDVRYAPYSVWLIGAPDSKDDSVARHLTLQMAPVRGEVYREHPDQMYPCSIRIEVWLNFNRLIPAQKGGQFSIRERPTGGTG